MDCWEKSSIFYDWDKHYDGMKQKAYTVSVAGYCGDHDPAVIFASLDYEIYKITRDEAIITVILRS